jgi:hypothetical protein
MNVSPFLSVNRPCNVAMQWVKEKIVQAGLRPVQTFDLHTARLALHDCPCPNHGMADCDCQMVILLVYGNTPEPITLILHGNDGQTWLSFADGLRQGFDSKLLTAIRQALDTNAPTKISQNQ